MILNNGKKRIPIGYEDFKQLMDGGFYYVDKSMLIYELLHNGGQNNLITRPRRFGKTLNFSMLKYFFDITEKESIFTGLNNLKTNTILSVKYSGFFGFEEYEVLDLLKYYGLENKFEDIKICFAVTE